MEAITFHELLQELPSIIIFTKSHLRDGDSAEKIKHDFELLPEQDQRCSGITIQHLTNTENVRITACHA